MYVVCSVCTCTQYVHTCMYSSTCTRTNIIIIKYLTHMNVLVLSVGLIVDTLTHTHIKTYIFITFYDYTPNVQQYI